MDISDWLCTSTLHTSGAARTYFKSKKMTTEGSNLERNAVLLHQLESGSGDTMYDYVCFIVSSLMQTFL